MMKELFKETWSDYWKNLFNPNAPITRDNYLRERWMMLVLIIPLVILWLIITSNDGLYTESYYNLNEKAQIVIEQKAHFIAGLSFLTLWLVIFILSFALEMRMFKRRNKSPQLYLISHILYLVIGFIYCISAYLTGHDIKFFLLLFGFLLVNLTSHGNNISTREENWV